MTSFNKSYKIAFILIISSLLFVQLSFQEPTTTANPIVVPITGQINNNNLPTTTTTTTIANNNAAETDDPEVITSTVASPADSLGAINPEDNNSTIIINNPTEDNSTESGSSNAESSNSDEGFIEAKSVSNKNDFNSATDDVKPAKIIAMEAPDEPGKVEDDNSSYEDVTTTLEPPTKKKALLNMTQIDEIYNEGYRSEEEVVDSWIKMGKKIKKTVGGLIGSMVPMALNMTQEAKISNNCSGAMLKWVLSMNHLKLWALKMLDASGKPVAGLLEGTMTMFGNYRQCVNIRAPDDDEIEFAGEFREYFRGKYCIIQAKPWLPKKDRFYSLNSKIKAIVEASEDNPWYEKTVFEEINEWLLAFNYINIRMDLCIPSLCSREDIQSIINYLLKGIDFKARVLRCEMDSPDDKYKSLIETGSNELAEALVASASTSGQENFEERTAITQLGWILVPLIAIIVVLIATGLTWAIKYQDDIEDDVTEIGGSHSSNSNIYKPKRFKHTITSLSLKRSISSHLNVDYEQLADDKPLALYGIRFLLVMWVISVEFAINFKFEYLRELLPLKDLIFWWPLQVVINSTLQYDSIILLTAFTMSCMFCLDNYSVNIAKSLTRFVLDKYIRLMPSIMITVAFTILLPLLYRGPVWNDLVTKQSAVCQSTGWMNIIFLQNYLPYKEICLPYTWLLCIELQLIVLATPIIYYLNKTYVNNLSNNLTKNGKAAKSGLSDWLKTTPGMILVTCIAVSSGYSFYNVYSKDLPPSYLYTMPDPDSKAIYFDEHFMRIWTHLPVFAIGIIAGICCRRKTSRSSPFIMNFLATLVALSTMAAIIFSTYDWSLNGLPKPLIAGLYDSISRLLWSLSFVWLLYMLCVPNESRQMSYVSKLLGAPIMVCLGKLSFLIYLIHPLVHTSVLAIQEQPIYSSWLMLFHILIGNMTITIALASFVSLFIEMPCRNLFRRCGGSILLTETSKNTTTKNKSNNTSSDTINCSSSSNGHTGSCTSNTISTTITFGSNKS